MILKPFISVFADTIYRVDYFVVCAQPTRFLRSLRRALTPHHIDVQSVVDACNHELESCNGRLWRLQGIGKNGKINDLVVMWLLPGADISVVTHEAWHAARWVFTTRGIAFDAGIDSYSNGVDEPMAYYLQWIVRSVLNLRR